MPSTDGVGLLEPGVDVALGRFLAGLEVPLQRAGRRLLLGVLEDVLLADEVVEFVVLDLDRPQRVLGVLLGVGGDRGDLVAGVEQFAADGGLLRLPP